jgi:hypothetical protein
MYCNMSTTVMYCINIIKEFSLQLQTLHVCHLPWMLTKQWRSRQHPILVIGQCLVLISGRTFECFKKYFICFYSVPPATELVLPRSYDGGLLPNPSPVILSPDVIYCELLKELNSLDSSASIVTGLQASISRKHDPPPTNSQRFPLSSRAFWPGLWPIQPVIQSVLLRLSFSAGKTA